MNIPGVSFAKSLFIMDNSPRTKAISRPTWITIGALVMIIVCMIWAMAGCRHFSVIQANSSTPIGSEIKFSRSHAKMTLTGLYTDKNEDVLVARLTPDDKANQQLPYKGTDFTVFVQSDAVKGYQEIPILFGKMGTDGDYMLIVPKPESNVYSFVLVDSSSQAKRLDTKLNRSKNPLDKNESVARALSDFNQQLGDNSATGEDTGKDSATTRYDMAGLRMTLDPAADGDQYRPTQLDTQLLNPRTKQFEFEKFYQDVFIDTAVKKLTSDYNGLQAEAAQAEETVKIEQDRLAANPADEAAARNLRDAQKQADDAKKAKEDKAAELTRYQALNYDPGLFQNFQDKAVVVNK